MPSVSPLLASVPERFRRLAVPFGGHLPAKLRAMNPEALDAVLAESNNSEAARRLGFSREKVRRLRRERNVPLPEPTPKRAAHGTRAGYMAHLTAGTDPEQDCPRDEAGVTCAEAHRRYQRDYMRKRGGHQPRRID